ncbi:MAG: Verru_Chthon cassette protein C [Verrucomicrobiales bacterium]
MKYLHRRMRGPRPAFTLLELMVSMTVLSLILLLVFQMLDTTQKTFQSSRARAATFKEARVAFEGLTRRIGQAMLNTYFDYQYPNNNSTLKPTGYERKSDLHFVSGRAQIFLGGGNFSTHCVFFQAPLGFSLRPENQSFGSLLNSWGYYIERNNDNDQIPNFLKAYNYADTSRERYRLMEFRPPTESMQVYGANLRTRYTTDWFAQEIHKKSQAGGVPFSRPIAENIIALIIEPKRSEKPGTAILAPQYQYDSRRFQKNNNPRDETKHQLPPLVEVTMVAIDENSAIRNEQVHGSLQELVAPTLFRNAATYRQDLGQLEKSLIDKKITYRVFNETVAIRASKFSDPQFLR